MRPGESVPKERAVALCYNEGTDFAPVVSAIGEQNCARLMTKMARRFGIPVVGSKELINRLSQLKVADQIPVDLYDEVARLFEKL